jgi:hypothetical protein
MFTEVLPIVIKRWKEMECPPDNERINTVVSPCSGVLVSHGKECNTDPCYHMEEP